MLNLLDIIQLKLHKSKKKISREVIEEVLSAAINGTKEYTKEGHDVYWIGLCKFTWKQKAKTKKEAKEWTEHPYLAEGNKLRCLPLPELEDLAAKGQIFKEEREQNEQIKVAEIKEN